MSETKKRYFSPLGRVVLVFFLVIMFGVLFLAWIRERQKPEKLKVLEIEQEAVYINEAMIYYRLMEDAFEQKGGEEIWTLDVLGVDVRQTALDRVLESVIRIKAAAKAAGSVSSSEEAEILRLQEVLKKYLGEEYCRIHEIDDETLAKVAEDNYLAYRYEHNVRFLYSEIEDDIQSGMTEKFGVYDNTRTMNDYLSRVILEPIMFYTGTFVEGEWTMYPAVQREQILEIAKSVRERIDTKNYYTMAKQFGENASVSDNPVFQQGEVTCLEERFGQVYKGQIDRSVRDQIFSLQIGEISPIIETPYGYLIVRITGFRQPTDKDKEEYDRQLSLAKAEYRTELTEELKARRLSLELDRLVEETEVVRYDDLFAEYVREHE
ncbi:MAG: peptidyl-prolyl cis-trans isomerase [Firmicutes bacterium]|nr:peptidyl-prolyl cis-trans isomerase [Bacillota bacterium]